MKIIGLISGGKDSCFAMMEAIKYGHTIIGLANLHGGEIEELDSFMFQTVATSMTCAIAECMDLPLVRRKITGKSLNIGIDYNLTNGDEVEDLFELLLEAKNRFPEMEGVCTGAVLSTYQRHRVENVCSRLGLTSLAYLWQRDQHEILTSMLDGGVEAVLVKIAAMGLKTNMLGKQLNELVSVFEDLNESFGFHVCGEGGEYETLTLDCPLFKKRIVLDEIERIVVDDVPFAPVAQLGIKKYHLEDKLDTLEIPVEPKHTPNNSLWTAPPGGTHVMKEEISCASSPPLCMVNDSDTYCWVRNISGNLNASNEEQIQECMELLKELLHERGYTLQNIAFINLYVKDMSLFQIVNSIYCTYFTGFAPPSRACIELPMDTCLIIDALACRAPRSVLHVKSLSTWAPVCIGPYAQANSVDDLTLIAGQIPLEPVNMQISHLPTCTDHLNRCFDHTNAVLSALDVGCRDACVVSMIVYVASKLISTKEIESIIGERAGATTHFMILRVPRLPRDAAVEVEMIAKKNPETETPWQCKVVKLNALNPNMEDLENAIQSFGLSMMNVYYCRSSLPGKATGDAIFKQFAGERYGVSLKPIFESEEPDLVQVHIMGTRGTTTRVVS